MKKYSIKKLPSLSIILPFFNDSGTVLKQIYDSFYYGNLVAEKLEVIAIHGGASHDSTWRKIRKAQRKYAQLKVLNCRDNDKGYAVIFEGFKIATMEWVFYTDGDRQYHIVNIIDLVEAQSMTHAHFINGYKVNRGDSFMRRFLGSTYSRMAGILLGSPVRDPHCDFRLMRRHDIQRFTPELSGAGWINELLMYVKTHKISVAQVPVPHYQREYGASNYSIAQLTMESVSGVMNLLTRRIFRLGGRK